MKTSNKTDLIPISKWNDFYEFPTIGALRQYRYYNINNFNNYVIRKIGKRLYIKVSAFFEWIEANNEM